MATLEQLDDGFLVLFNFQSLGPALREIDLAIISPWGVDIIELKDKQGQIAGPANGVWSVTRRGQTEQIFNKKGGVQENPYEQTLNNMDDFKRWLVKEYGNSGLFVRPIVLIPAGHPRSWFEPHHIVKCVNGVDNLHRSLCVNNPKRAYWSRTEYESLPHKLGLSELGVAILSGSIRHRFTDQPIAGATISIEGVGIVASDTRGEFHVVVPAGSLDITVRVPGLDTPVSLRETALQGKYRLPPIYVETPDPDAERDIRDVRELFQQAVLEGDETVFKALIARLEEFGVPVNSQSRSTIDEASTSNTVGSNKSDAPKASEDDLYLALAEFASARRKRPAPRSHLLNRGLHDFERGLDRLTRHQLASLLATLEAMTLVNSLRQTSSAALSTVGTVIGKVSKRIKAQQKDAEERAQEAEAAAPREVWQISEEIGRLVEEYVERSAPELRARVRSQIGRKLGVKASPDRAYWYRQVLERLADRHKLDVNALPTPELTAQVFEALAQEFVERTVKNIEQLSAEQRADVEQAVADRISGMSPDEKDLVMRDLGLDELNSRALITGLASAGGVAVSFASAQAAGFGLYVAATTITHAIATTLLGITLPFAAYTGITSAISFLISPVVAGAAALVLVVGVGRNLDAGTSRLAAELAFVQILVARLEDIVTNPEPATSG